MEKTLNIASLQIRGDTASVLATKNPQLKDRELCFETDTRKFKIGNGVGRWNDLPYVSTGSSAASGGVLNISYANKNLILDIAPEGVLSIDNILTESQLANLNADHSQFVTSDQIPDTNSFAKKSDIPTNISAFTNDSDYIKSTDIPTTQRAAGVKAGNWLSIDDGSTNAANRGKMKCGELTLAQYNSATGYTFISKTTLTNVLNDLIGNVNAVLTQLGVK